MKRFIFLLLCGLFVALAVQARDVVSEPDVGIEIGYSITQESAAILPMAIFSVSDIPDVGMVIEFNLMPAITDVIQNVYCNPDYGLSIEYCLISNFNQNISNIAYLNTVQPRARHV